jgi:hypothetical protein
MDLASSKSATMCSGVCSGVCSGRTKGVARAWQQRVNDIQLFLREKQQDLDPRFTIFHSLVPETTGLFGVDF